jgi:protease-4
MSLETDLLVDRRRLRRKLSVWRVLAFLLLVAALLMAALAAGGRGALVKRADHIARVKVSGFVGDQTATLDMFEKIARSGARGVIVQINSPGGATNGGEALYNGLRKLSKEKPTVAVIDGLGASAAYMAALGTDHIVSRRAALVGSIGVLVQYPNVWRLLDTIGVKVETVKSSPLKAAPNGVEPTSPEALAALASLVDDTYDWFKGLVKERRGVDDATLTVVTDGRIFTGKQALDLKLVDEIGDEDSAIAWLETTRGVPVDLPVEDWERSGSSGTGFGFGRAALAGLVKAAGLGVVADAILSAPANEPGALDGLVSLWHPHMQK